MTPRLYLTPANPRERPSVADEALLGRGVYAAPYLKDGHPALMMILDNHEVVAIVPIRDGVDREKARRSLEALLDVLDPQSAPALTLLRSGDVPSKVSAADTPLLP
jgi:hypothetical protein